MQRLSCAPCGQCRSGSVCVARTCLRKRTLNDDINLCLNGAKRCGDCSNNSHCSGGLVCHGFYCVPEDYKDTAVRRCSGNAEACELCTDDNECESEHCEDGRCADCDYGGAARECDECYESEDCVLGLSCSDDGVCLREDNEEASEERCFPEEDECGPCAHDSDCVEEAHSCIYGKCIVNEGQEMEASIARCFGKDKSSSESLSSENRVATCSVRRAFELGRI